MVRISFFSPNITPLILCNREGYGGAELDILNIARKLCGNKGYEVNIITITNEIQVPTVFFM